MSEVNESRSWEPPEPEAEAEALIQALRRDLERLKEQVAAFRETCAGDLSVRGD